tara:strand:- start:1236 stop:1343 length:108 start_codon:yes stop_codon:yes gene_type:complete
MKSERKRMSVEGIIASPWFLFVFLGVMTVLLSIVG